MSKTLKVRNVGNSNIITLPKSMCDILNIQTGTELEIELFTKDSLLLKVS